MEGGLQLLLPGWKREMSPKETCTSHSLYAFVYVHGWDDLVGFDFKRDLLWRAAVSFHPGLLCCMGNKC